MGLVRGRRFRPAGSGLPRRRRLRAMVTAAVHNAGQEAAAGLREVRLAAIAAIEDARIVAILLLLAAAALALEMAASFHLI